MHEDLSTDLLAITYNQSWWDVSVSQAGGGGMETNGLLELAGYPVQLHR